MLPRVDLVLNLQVWHLLSHLNIQLFDDADADDDNVANDDVNFHQNHNHYHDE